MLNEELKLALKKDWDYFPHYEKSQGHFVGRREEKNKVENWFLRREKGCFLVSGERGVGKTALVYEALYKATQKNKRIIPVLINSSQLIIEESLSECKNVLEISAEKLEEKIIINLIRRLYTAAKGKLDKSLQEKLDMLYRKAVSDKTQIKEENRLIKESEQEEKEEHEIEGKFSLDQEQVRNFLSYLGVIIGMTFFYQASQSNLVLNILLGSLFFLYPKTLSYRLFKYIAKKKATMTSSSVEELYISDKSVSNLEYDLYALLDGASSIEKPYKIIFVIDEMDKIKQTTNVKITDLITTFKNLFTLSSGIFVFIAGKEMYDIVELSKEQRDIAYTLFSDKIFICRPNFKDLEDYVDEIIDEPHENFIEKMIYHDFRNLLCYQSKSDFFELHFKIRDYIETFDNYDRPILKIESLDESAQFHASIQKVLGQIYNLNKYRAPSSWHQNNLLLADLYKFIDISWFKELFLRKSPPLKDDSLELRTYQAETNLVEYLLRLGAISLKGEETKTIEDETIEGFVYNWTRSKINVLATPQELLDYEKAFLDNLAKFSLCVNEIDDVSFILQGKKIVEYDETRIFNNDVQKYCDIDVFSIYTSNQKYKDGLNKEMPEHILREELDSQTKKILTNIDQLKSQVIIIVERFITEHVQLTNFSFANFNSDVNLFSSAMLSIREGVVNNKIPHICFYRKVPKCSRQILVIKDMPEKLYEDHKDLINENAANHLIMNLNTTGVKYNLEYVQKNKRDKKIRGFIDIPIYESFANLQKVTEEVKKRDKELISDSEKETFLRQPINVETLKAYTEWKFPDIPVLENLNSRIPTDLDNSKHQVLKDIDNMVEKARPAVEAYFKEKPDLFQHGTDFITKSIGFIDGSFLSKHPFSQETRDAVKRLKRLIEKE